MRPFEFGFEEKTECRREYSDVRVVRSFVLVLAFERLHPQAFEPSS